MGAQDELIENLTYAELRPGQRAQMVRTLTMDDIKAFALVSGDINPAHVDAAYAEGTRFHGVIAHGMWAGALISSLLGTEFPGPGTIYLEQSLRFHRPVRVGDTLTVVVAVVDKDDATRDVRMDCVVTNQHGEQVVSGQALVRVAHAEGGAPAHRHAHDAPVRSRGAAGHLGAEAARPPTGALRDRPPLR